MSADSQHNLYVADYICDTIHTFSIDGTYLCSSARTTGDKSVWPLLCPCVSTTCACWQWYRYYLCVHHRGHSFENIWESWTTAVGQIKNPHSITADENGLVCVVDSRNNRVNVSNTNILLPPLTYTNTALLFYDCSKKKVAMMQYYCVE